METDVKKPSKRRRIHTSGTAEETLWQQCHSGFDNDIILKEQLGLTVRPGKGRKKDSKVPERKTKEISSLLEKDADIDWESSSSSSSEEETPSHLQPGQRSKEPAAKRARPQQPMFVTSLDLSHNDASVKESFIVQKVEESPESTPSVDREVEEADISDYDSSEEAGSLQVRSSPPKQAAVSPKITSTQSPLISSFTVSTQGSSDTSPISSSQWVDKVRRGQQTTPCKEGSKSGKRAEAEEGKDSAKKRVKFTRFGFAEKLQKLINREKSDVAIWNHQASESAASNSSCSVRIETVRASRGLFVARCRKVASSPSTGPQGDGDLQERLVLLFSRKTVEDLKLKSGTTLTVHPPWQTMVLPDTGETVLLCTYYCKLSGTEGQFPSSPIGGMVTHSQDVGSVPRPVFRPNRLFAEEGVNSKLSLNTPTLHQNENDQISTSLLDTVSAKGPSFDFEFDLRGLVMRVCRSVSPRPSTYLLTEERWRMLVQDGDGTIFEISSVSSLDLTSWRGKLMDFKALRISQRVSRTSNPSLFSMIDSLSQPPTLEEECKSNMSPKLVTSSFSLQRISYVATLENAEAVRECKDSESLTMYHQPSPGFNFRLSDICESSLHLRHRRANFWATLLHAASQGAADLLAPSWQAEASDLLLFVSDSSLPTTSESYLGQNGYVMLEKLASCPTSVAGCSSLKELSGSTLKFEDVNIKDDGSFILDCYSNVTRESEINDKDKNKTISERNGEGVTIHFPELTEASRANSLVTLTGTFEGVDQDTAYSWPTCNICGSNRLKEDSSGSKLFCVICDQEVASPITEIHLEAIVKSPILKQETTIKVLLKQKTVADMFGEPSSDKPFDLKRILGKPYKKTNCFVRKSLVDGDRFVLEEI